MIHYRVLADDWELPRTRPRTLVMRRPATSSELTMITSLASLSFSVSLVVQNMAGLLVRGRLPWVTAS